MLLELNIIRTQELTLNAREDSRIELIDNDDQTHGQEEGENKRDTEEKEEEELAGRIEEVSIL